MNTTNETYFCLVHQVTKEKVRYEVDCEDFGDSEYSLRTDTSGELPVWKVDTYEEALSVLHSPHIKWYASYYKAPVHSLDWKDYNIMKCKVETIVNVEESTLLCDKGLAKELYSKIMYWKYGEDGLYSNSKLLAEKLRKNTGKIDKHDLEEYLTFKGE